MASDLFSTDLTTFLEKALGIQLAEPKQQLTEETLKAIARKAGLTEEDWENLGEKLKAHLALGRNFLRFNNHADAIIELEHAVALAPYRADVLLDCGKAHSARWDETKACSSKERAESLFHKCLELEADNADAAEQLSLLKKVGPRSRFPRKIVWLTALFALAGGVSAWLGISAFSEKPKPGDLPRLLAPAVVTATGLPTYPPAILPPLGVPGPLAFDSDLVAHWSFDGNSPNNDSTAESHSLTTAGQVESVEGIEGRASRFFANTKSGLFTQPSPEFKFSESITVSAWVKPVTRQGMIAWFGDHRLGRDPWMLTLLGNGQLRFRTDRSVTSKPTFPVAGSEITFSPDGVPKLSQQIRIDSPGLLPLNQWSFVTARIEKVSEKESVITLFVNGTAVSEARTTETIDYGTEGMWIAVGSVHQGENQNFNGAIDEVRIYRRALSADQIREIYRQPRRDGAAAAP